MTKLSEIKLQLVVALEQIEAYEKRATKAESARIRKTLGAIKNGVTGVRAELVSADKA